MDLQATPIYAALLGIQMIILTVRVIMLRSSLDISLGDGGNPDLLERVRGHGNFSEFVPLALILIALVELGGLAVFWVHILGMVLVASRVIQPFGLRADVTTTPLRIIGNSASFAVIMAASLILLFQNFV